MPATIIIRRGLRRSEDSPAAASWSRGRLSVALAVVAALHMMTYWNLDLAAREQLATLRADAGRLALSVAPARVPDADNAALIYEQAFDGIPARDPFRKTALKGIYMCVTLCLGRTCGLIGKSSAVSTAVKNDGHSLVLRQEVPD